MKIIQNKNINCYEKFFCERTLELLHRTTIDSYRIRVMNAKLIIHELLYLCEGWINGRIHDFRTIESCKLEVETLLREDEVIVYHTVNKDYFINFLSETIKEKDNGIELKNNFVKLKNIATTILRENDNYAVRLLDRICYYISNPIIPIGNEFLTFEKIDKLISSLVTHLISMGYHKSYLTLIFNSIFLDERMHTFSYIKEEIYRMNNVAERKYRVWVKFSSSVEICDSLKSSSLFTVHDSINEILPIVPSVAKEFKKFNNRFFNLKYIVINVSARDYFSALYLAKTIISESLDILNLGFGNVNSHIIDRAYVVDTNRPEYARFQEIRYVLDGKYKYGQLLFKDIYDRIPSLLEKKQMHSETKEKIKSAFHYLRMGNEALEIEHKVINYWFGLEYLFSNAAENSFKRIITHLPKLQAISYIK